MDVSIVFRNIVQGKTQQYADIMNHKDVSSIIILQIYNWANQGKIDFHKTNIVVYVLNCVFDNDGVIVTRCVLASLYLLLIIKSVANRYKCLYIRCAEFGVNHLIDSQ